MSRICGLNLRNGKSRHNRKNERPLMQKRRRLLHRLRSSGGFYRKDEYSNMGQKIICPDLCMPTIDRCQHIASRRLVFRYVNMRRRNRFLRRQPGDYCLSHRSAADDADLYCVTHNVLPVQP